MALIYPDQNHTPMYYKTRPTQTGRAIIGYGSSLKTNFEINRRRTSLILEAKADFTSVNRLVCCF